MGAHAFLGLAPTNSQQETDTNVNSAWGLREVRQCSPRQSMLFLDVALPLTHQWYLEQVTGPKDTREYSAVS